MVRSQIIVYITCMFGAHCLRHMPQIVLLTFCSYLCFAHVGHLMSIRLLDGATESVHLVTISVHKITASFPVVYISYVALE